MIGNLRKGDIIKSTRTMEVVATGGEFRDGVTLRDVTSLQRFFVGHGSDQGSWRFEMVKKAAPKRPKVGDVIDGKILNATQWKRGTVLRLVGHYAHMNRFYMLNEQGEWYGSRAANNGIPFSAWLVQGYELEVIYLP